FALSEASLLEVSFVVPSLLHPNNNPKDSKTNNIFFISLAPSVLVNGSFHKICCFFNLLIYVVSGSFSRVLPGLECTLFPLVSPPLRFNQLVPLYTLNTTFFCKEPNYYIYV